MEEAMRPEGLSAKMLDGRRAAVGGVALLAAIGCLIRFDFSAHGVIAAFVAAVLIVLAAIDLERRIIPDVILLPATAVTYVAQIAFYPHHALEWTVAALGCSLFFFLTHLAYSAGLGMGDVKLGLLLGAALGYSVLAALFFGLLASAVLGVILIATQGASARKKAIPLGPFLAGGALLVLLLG